MYDRARRGTILLCLLNCDAYAFTSESGQYLVSCYSSEVLEMYHYVKFSMATSTMLHKNAMCRIVNISFYLCKVCYLSVQNNL